MANHKQHCASCGATPHMQTPWRIGKEGNCQVCGASKHKPSKVGRKSKATLAADEKLDAMLCEIAQARGVAIAIKPEPVPPPEQKPEPVRPMNREKTVSNALATEAAWQTSHDKRMAALRRLGLDVRANNGTDRQDFIGGREWRGAVSTWKPDHRSELVEAARSGDAQAVRRATDLYGDTWQEREQRTG